MRAHLMPETREDHPGGALFLAAFRDSPPFQPLSLFPVFPSGRARFAKISDHYAINAKY
jgi:hypothetical protein